MHSISTYIRQRRSIYPKSYINRPIERALLEEILENANFAPTHKLTQPWRFKVFVGESLTHLGDYLAAAYQAGTTPETFSADKYEKMKTQPTKAGAVIVICMQKSHQLPEWEEVAAVACAVQNMSLTASAYGIGNYWSTPGAILKATAFLGLQPDEQCLGMLYLGYHNAPDVAPSRTPIVEKVTWM